MFEQELVFTTLQKTAFVGWPKRRTLSETSAEAARTGGGSLTTNLSFEVTAKPPRAGREPGPGACPLAHPRPATKACAARPSPAAGPAGPGRPAVSGTPRPCREKRGPAPPGTPPSGREATGARPDTASGPGLPPHPPQRPEGHLRPPNARGTCGGKGAARPPAPRGGACSSLIFCFSFLNMVAGGGRG